MIESTPKGGLLYNKSIRSLLNESYKDVINNNSDINISPLSLISLEFFLSRFAYVDKKKTPTLYFYGLKN